MNLKTYSIGELARLSGATVRRIRFYSDRGLLPPSARTEANYRIYTNDDLARLQLICSLRTAGIDLAHIAEVIAQRLPIQEVLRARLGILEIEMSAQSRMAEAIRTTLSLSHPTEGDFIKVLKMLHTSNAEMQAKIRDYVNCIAAGSAIDDCNLNRLLDFCACELPSNPTTKQLEIWNKIETLIDDGDFRKSSNISIKQMYPSDVNLSAYLIEHTTVLDLVEKAWGAGSSSDSAQTQEIIRNFVNFEATYQQIDALAIIEDRLFQFECAAKNKSTTHLYSLIEQLRGDRGVEKLQRPPTEFWSWLHDALIIQRDQARPKHEKSAASG